MDHKTKSENEIVIQVPRGAKQHVRVEEQAEAAASGGSAPEIVVRVSSKRKWGVNTPVIGVIVK